jgi:hypothetical protein
MIMMELLAVILFCWIFFKAVGLAFRMAWGAARIAASLLFAVAVPLLVLCLVFAGGIFLLLPLALVGIAFGLLKACV